MGEIIDVITGAKNPLAWVTSGRKPVDKYVSLSRAGRCVICPCNGVGPLTEWFTEPVANFLKKLIQKRHALTLETLYDAALGTCEACHCVLVLKVHEPIDLVLKGLKPKQKDKLWEQCWIRSESGEPQSESETTHDK